MAGASIIIKVDNREMQGLLKRVVARMDDTTPAMRIIGEIVRTSVVRNFEKSGRPTKWKALAPATLKSKKGNKILIEQGMAGGLMGSISYKAMPDRVIIGTNKKYAAIHQFGGTIKHSARDRILHFKTFKSGPRKGRTLFSKKRKATHGMKVKGKAYNVNIPARPFLIVQDEDWVEINAELKDYIVGVDNAKSK